MRKSNLLLLSFTVLAVVCLSGCVTTGDRFINAHIGSAARAIQKTDSIADAHLIAGVIESGSKQLEMSLGKADVGEFNIDGMNKAIEDSKDEHEALGFFGAAAKKVVDKIPYGNWFMVLATGLIGFFKNRFTSKKLVSVISGVDEAIDAIEDKDIARAIKIALENKQKAMDTAKGIATDMHKLRAAGILRPSKEYKQA